MNATSRATPKFQSIADALAWADAKPRDQAFWRASDYPPVDATGDADADAHLAGVFTVIAECWRHEEPLRHRLIALQIAAEQASIWAADHEMDGLPRVAESYRTAQLVINRWHTAIGGRHTERAMVGAVR